MNDAAKLLDLTSYDVILVNSSAGKDSQAMLDYVVELAKQAGVLDRVVVVHADLGRVEWQGTRELAERQAAAYGVRFANEARGQAYGKHVEPIRLAAQALGFPNGWHTSPEYVEAAAAAEAELAANADFQLTHFSSPLYYALVRESRRRRTNASRAASAAKRAELAVAEGTFAMGEKVQVYAFGRWYNGEVVKFGRTGKVTVKYTTGTGRTFEKAVLSSMIRKA